MTKNDNYWFSTCPTIHQPVSSLPRNVDVAIIGGGIAGISLLHTLFNAGYKNLCLLEESTVGSHASGRSSGQLVFRGSKLFHQFQNEVGLEYLKFMLENNQRFRRGLRSASFDHDLRDSGGLRLAVNDEELELLEKESRFINKNSNITCPILSSDEVRGILPQTGFVGGMFVPIESTFNPYKVVNGMREMLNSKVYTGCRVASVEEGDKGFNIEVEHRGVIRAQFVIYCTNAYTPDLLPQIKDSMIPFRGQMLATDNLEEKVFQIVPNLSMSSNDCSEYFRLHGGRLLVGGMRHTIRGQQVGHTYDNDISPSVLEKLKGFMDAAFPSLEDVKATHSWSGIMCSTPDGLPLIGQVPGRTKEYIFAGFNGYGFSHALGGSMIIRDLVMNDISSRPGSEIFSPDRFAN